MARRFLDSRRKALLAVAVISTLIFLLTLTGNPYRALSRFLFGSGRSDGRSSGPTVFRFGNDLVSVIHGHHRLYADRVDRLSDASVSIIYGSRATLQVSANCSSVTQLGKKRASSWRLCTAGPFSPLSPCFGISFDSNARWQFEAYSFATKFGCQVILFDPTMPRLRTRTSSLVHLRESLPTKKGLGAWVTDTYSEHLKRLGAESVVVDVLEVYIGDPGWKSIDTAITDESLLNVKQLLLAAPISRNATVELKRDELRVLTQLDQVGFRLWHQNLSELRNQRGELIRQFHFINQRFAADTRSARNSLSSVARLQDSLRQLTNSG